MAKYTDRFKDLDSQAIDELISEARDYQKQLKEKERQERINEVMKNLTIGSTAYTKDKKNVIKGTVKALTESSATLETEDGRRINRRYNKIALKKDDLT